MFTLMVDPTKEGILSLYIELLYEHCKLIYISYESMGSYFIPKDDKGSTSNKTTPSVPTDLYCSTNPYRVIKTFLTE